MRVIKQSVKLLYPSTPYEKKSIVRGIEYAARNCYDSSEKITDDSYEVFVPSLIKNGHDSMLEFADIMLEMVTSRDVMAEWTRHRLVSNAVRSQRYVLEDAGGSIAYIMPQFVIRQSGPFERDKRDEAVRVWEDACRTTSMYYRDMIMHGASKQDARKVLNNSVATKIITKMNARTLRHILKLRLSKAAYPEMRYLARLILEEVQTIPILFDDLMPLVQD